MTYPEYPENIYIGITDKCNANCIICWRIVSDQVFLDFDAQLLEKIKPFISRAKMIGWWGDGELFAHGNIDDVLQGMADMPDVRHTFSTNGKMLSKYAHKLSKINISEIIISIDGATEGTLSRIRRGIHLEYIVDGINNMQKAFSEADRDMPKLIFAFTSMMSNIYELPMLVELAHKLNVQEIRVQPLNPHHSNLEAEALYLVAPNLERYYFVLSQKLGNELGVEVNHCNPARL